MQWVAPSEKDTATSTLEKRLWDAADQIRANLPVNVNTVDKERLKESVGPTLRNCVIKRNSASFCRNPSTAVIGKALMHHLTNP
jgi:hypothetical protein